MGREVRMVPAGWQHPKDDNGRYIPLIKDYHKAIQRWDEENEMWQKGKCRAYVGDNEWVDIDEKYADWSYADYEGDRPQASDYMPSWDESERTHYMMYENTSEGTPKSPAFETPEELARWLVDNNVSWFAAYTWNYEQWMSIIDGGREGNDAK